MGFRDTVSADLAANVGTKGLIAGVAAFVFHPGFSTIFLHRLTVATKDRGFPRISKLLWNWNVRRSGCHFHPESIIEPGLFLPHPTAIVIGSGVRVGSSATIYQGVTIGKGAAHNSYPILGRHVTIYPNSVIIGEISIGEAAIVGAGSIVLQSIPSGAVAAGNPAKIIRLAKS